MANCHFLAAAPTDDGTYSGGSWAAGLPLSNLTTQPPKQVARSTNATTGSTQYVVDLGVAQRITMFAWINHNLSSGATIRVRVSNSSDGSSPSLDHTIDAVVASFAWGSLPWGSFPWAGVLSDLSVDPHPGKQTTFYKSTTTVTGQYIFVNITNTSNPDGYVQIGRFLAGEAFIPRINMSYGAGLGFIDDSVQKRTMGGSVFFNRKPVRRKIDLELGALSESEAYGNVYEMQHALGVTKGFLFVYNPDDAGDLVLRRTIYGTFTSLEPIITATADPAYPYSARVAIEELI
jgi:hypothetical protein